MTSELYRRLVGLIVPNRWSAILVSNSTVPCPPRSQYYRIRIFETYFFEKCYIAVRGSIGTPMRDVECIVTTSELQMPSQGDERRLENTRR
jgi:hypothetical protein